MSCTSSLPAFFTGCVDSLDRVTSSIRPASPSEAPHRRPLPPTPVSPCEAVSSSYVRDHVTSSSCHPHTTPCTSGAVARRIPHILPLTPVSPEAVTSSQSRGLEQVTSSCHSLRTLDNARACLPTPQISCSTEAVSSSWSPLPPLEGVSRRQPLPPEAVSSTQSPALSEAVSSWQNRLLDSIPCGRGPQPSESSSVQSRIISSQMVQSGEAPDRIHFSSRPHSPCASDASSTQSRDSGIGSSSPGTSAQETTSTPTHRAVHSGRGVKRQLVLDPPQTNGHALLPPPAKRRPPDNQLLTPLLPPPPPNLAFLGNNWEQVSKDMYEYFERHRQTEAVFFQKMKLRDALFDVIQKSFPNCKLYVVGSSMNGLGTNSSDMDMCLMLPHQEINQESQAAHILNFLHKEISKCEYVESPVVIRAKVPILKFMDRISGVEVDLNINNIVGIRNTQLLNSYSRLDGRVKPLVLVVKSWARAYNINDAKNMTISSYSLVLMVIHYLQFGCQPPVLPSLQQIQPDKFLPDSDISQLLLMEKLPPFESRNTINLGELFIGFLEYYTQRFDYQNEAISIRLGRTLPKRICVNYISPKNKRGMWKLLSIEEPFDRTNTARSVYDTLAFNRICWSFNTSYNLLNRTRDLFSILPISQN